MPFAIVFKISLSDIALSIPPYLPQLDLAKGWEGFTKFLGALDFENFEFLMMDDLYYKAYLSSLKIAAISTFLTLLIGYPIAYAMTRKRGMAPNAFDVGDPAVLDILPDPRLRMDWHFGTRGL